jgi:pheromone a factor receptor
LGGRFSWLTLLCYVGVKLTVGAQIGVNIACMCITRHLESIASGRGGIASAKDQKNRKIVEAALCIGVPIVYMALRMAFFVKICAS